MKNHMKLALSALLSLLSMPIYCHVTRMKNNTDGQLVTKLFYALCGDIDRIVNPGETVSVDNGGCCLYQVSARGTSGAVNTHYIVHTPNSTGAGISCQSNDITFQKVAGQLSSMRGLEDQPETQYTNILINNNTNQELAVTFNYFAPDICSSETKVIKPNSELRLQIGLCCLKTLNVRSKSSRPLTVNAVGCARTAYTIKQDSSGNLVSESAPW